MYEEINILQKNFEELKKDILLLQEENKKFKEVKKQLETYYEQQLRRKNSQNRRKYQTFNGANPKNSK